MYGSCLGEDKNETKGERETNVKKQSNIMKMRAYGTLNLVLAPR